MLRCRSCIGKRFVVVADDEWESRRHRLGEDGDMKPEGMKVDPLKDDPSTEHVKRIDNKIEQYKKRKKAALIARQKKLRKLDTRHKIVHGGGLLARARRGVESARAEVRANYEEANDRDKALIEKMAGDLLEGS